MNDSNIFIPCNRGYWHRENTYKLLYNLAQKKQVFDWKDRKVYIYCVLIAYSSREGIGIEIYLSYADHR